MRFLQGVKFSNGHLNYQVGIKPRSKTLRIFGVLKYQDDNWQTYVFYYSTVTENHFFLIFEQIWVKLQCYTGQQSLDFGTLG